MSSDSEIPRYRPKLVNGKYQQLVPCSGCGWRATFTGDTAEAASASAEAAIANHLACGHKREVLARAVTRRQEVAATRGAGWLTAAVVVLVIAALSLTFAARGLGLLLALGVAAGGYALIRYDADKALDLLIALPWLAALAGVVALGWWVFA